MPAGAVSAFAAQDRRRVSLDPSGVAERAGTISPATVAYADRLVRSIPPDVQSAAQQPFKARAVIFCLLISRDEHEREKQLGLLGGTVEPACYRDVRELLGPVQSLGPETRIPLVDLCLPALRQMSPAQMRQFRQVVRQLVESDARVNLFEFALLRILAQQLRTADDPALRLPVEYFDLDAVRDEASLLIRALASASDRDTAAALESGARRLGMQLSRLDGAGLKDVNSALDRLQVAAPAVKQKLIDACAHTVAADGHVSVAEMELLRAIASTLDVPIPPLVHLSG
jgi:hypothetical protein